MAKQGTEAKPDKTLRRALVAFAALVGALMFPAVLYFGYDLLKSQVAPCSAIFEQTAASLETDIEFLEAKGSVVLGKEQLHELTERAQMTAINLEGCCQVLDAGKLNPEQFLECKQSARQYEGNLEHVVTLVREVIAAEEEQRPAKIEEVSRQVGTTLEAARASSRALNDRVVQVKREQAIAQLEVVAPAEVEVEAQEKEPNNDPLNTNLVELDTWITGAISEKGDADYYTFVTPETHRDWIQVELENRSTTLRPRLDAYNADKVHFGEVEKRTAGANLSYYFVTGPSTKYYVRIMSRHGNTQGVYLARIKPLRSYDEFEPNHDILQAKPISLDSPIQAGIMDGKDIDYYRVKTGATGGTLLVSLENRSTSLRPRLDVYNANKTRIGYVENRTKGANQSYQVPAEPNTDYFVRVADRHESLAGDYTLTVTVQ